MVVLEAEHSWQAICYNKVVKRKQTGSSCTLPCRSEMTAFTLQYLQYLAEDRRELSIGKKEKLRMDYFELFFTFTHSSREKRAYLIQGWGEALEEKRTQTKEKELVTEIWGASLLLLTEIWGACQPIRLESGASNIHSNKL